MFAYRIWGPHSEEEEGVLLKIEESIKDLEGIKQLNSTAVEGMGTVSIQVEEDYDVQSLLDEVKVQVDAIPSFPADTEKPVIYRQKIQQDVICSRFTVTRLNGS